MNLYVLNAVLWIFGIRGHIPHHRGFGSGRSESSFVANTSTLMRVLAAAAISVAALALVLWAAVWLAIRFL
jgi:hypothetical protein